MKEQINPRFWVLCIVILLAGAWRIFLTTDHSPISNFTPIGAMALFGGAYFLKKPTAYLFPLLTLFISDLILMQTVYKGYGSGVLYEGWPLVYISFGLMVFIGNKLIQKVTFKRVILSGFLAGLAHFIIVNFGVWLGGGLDITTGIPYTRDIAGLIKCYTLALPFFKNMVIGNLFYSAIMFGGFELAKYKFPVLNISILKEVKH